MVHSKEAAMGTENQCAKPDRIEYTGGRLDETCCGRETGDSNGATYNNNVCKGGTTQAIENIFLKVAPTAQSCPIGEKIGNRNIEQGKIPVLSCEGGCIRGEIARLTVNILVREEKYARSCHGELLTVPDSAIAKWTREADKVVLIDGCFLHCHERILNDLIGEDHLVVFDALSYYKKYTDIFDIEDVPTEERNQVACEVADWVLTELGNEELSTEEQLARVP